jgi:hypothetical protein
MSTLLPQPNILWRKSPQRLTFTGLTDRLVRAGAPCDIEEPERARIKNAPLLISAATGPILESSPRFLRETVRFCWRHQSWGGHGFS